MSQQPCYGYPSVNDPHDFLPDHQCCSAQEIEAHRTACEKWGTPNYEPNKGCQSEYDAEGKEILHVSRTSWGIGTNLISCCDECQEPSKELLTCHNCGPEFCEICWPIHAEMHDSNKL